jgi:hypothetical protein
MPILRYIVLRELPTEEPPTENALPTQKPEKKKPKRSSGPRNRYSCFRELCGLSSDLDMSPWTENVTMRVKRRHQDTMALAQQPQVVSISL